jgi:DNA-directed RNA polymerase beta' subunit
MSLSDIILAEADKQLNKNTKAVSDGAWFDVMIAKLASNTSSLPADNTAVAAQAAISALAQHKDKVVGLGANAFALFLDKLASGEEQEAASVYLQATGSADALIEAMDRGTLGVIEAKKQIDKMWSDAWEVVKSIAITGAKILLPLVLAAL